MADNKVKFLRGTSDEYAVAEKDSDTIYFTTDDGKLYIGDKKISGDGSITIDDTLSDTSTNPVQNKVVKQAIDNKADKTVATTSADGLMSAEDKGKLDAFEITATGGKLHDKDIATTDLIYQMDDTLSNSSRNPVQNKVIKQAIDNKADKSLYGDTTINVGRKTGTDVGICSDAEGWHTTASGNYSHTEGLSTTASNRCSHAEGVSTVASGESSHAEGVGAVAFGDYSHARGYNTITNNTCETASGKYNVSNDNTLFSIGDGTADDARHNAFEITTTGGKLHDKDIATTDLIPTTLPANGGNADTVGGKVPEKIFYDNGLSTDLNGATQSGCYATSPDTLNVPFSTWWLVDTTNYNNQFIVQKAHSIGSPTNTMSYIRNYANNVWSDWKEISTTPIKSTGWLTSPTNSEGDIIFNLPTDTGRTYIAACSISSIAILFSDGTNYRARIFDGNMKAVISTSITYRLWYIEE